VVLIQATLVSKLCSGRILHCITATRKGCKVGQSGPKKGRGIESERIALEGLAGDESAR
jgi:hypothetical protein